MAVKYLKTKKATYDLSKLTEAEYLEKTGKADYYEATGKKPPKVKEIEPKKGGD
jgi:hypothetical protein